MQIGGGILLDPTERKTLLVQCAVSGKYDFPKGKAQPGETVRDAAIRSIKCRTGYTVDIIHLDETTPIETRHKSSAATLFYVRNVPIDVKFAPQWEKAVSDAGFFDLNKIKSDGLYGTTGKKVTALVTKHLEDIKTFAM